MGGLINGNKKMKIDIVNTALLISRMHELGFVDALGSLQAGDMIGAANQIYAKSDISNLTAVAIENRIIEFITGKKAKIDLGAFSIGV